jgi:hypothetical protein
LLRTFLEPALASKLLFLLRVLAPIARQRIFPQKVFIQK